MGVLKAVESRKSKTNSPEADSKMFVHVMGGFEPTHSSVTLTCLYLPNIQQVILVA